MRYLEKSIYVKNDERYVYEVSSYTVSGNTLIYNLQLVCGYDYIDVDGDDTQGYVKANRFTEDVQCESVVQYFLKEGLEDCLKENGYTIIEQLPTIH